MLANIVRLSDAPLSRPKWPVVQFQRYVVGWPELGIIKVGSTSNGRRRWGTFLARGAQIIDLACYECAVSAEVGLHEAMGARYPKAFSHSGEAKNILGNGGGGFMECYSVPVSEWSNVARLALEA